MVEAETYREAPVGKVGPSPQETGPLAPGGANWLADPPRSPVHRSLSRSLTLWLLRHSYPVAVEKGGRSAFVACAVREWGRPSRRSIKGGTYRPSWRQFTGKALRPPLAVSATMARFWIIITFAVLLPHAKTRCQEPPPKLDVYEKQIGSVESQYLKGEYSKARKEAERILAELLALENDPKAKTSPELKHIPYVSELIAICHQAEENYSLARKELYRALNFAKAYHDDRVAADCTSGLGTVLDTTGEYNDALIYYARALENIDTVVNKLRIDGKIEVGRKVDAARNRDLSSAMVTQSTILLNLGRLHRVLGMFSKAEIELRKAAEIRLLNQNPQETPVDISDAYWNLGQLYSDQGNFSLAREFYDLACRYYPKSLNTSPDCIQIRGELAYVQYQMGDAVNAWKIIRDVNSTLEGMNLIEHWPYAHIQGDMANLLELSGKPEEALSHQLTAFALWNKKLGTKNRATLQSLSHLASLYTALHRYAEAEEALLKVKSVYLSIKSDERRALAPFEYGRVLSRLGTLAFILRRPWDQVFRDYHEGLTTLASAVGDTFHFTTEIRTQLGIVEAVAAHEGVIEWTTAWNDLMKGGRNYLDFLSPILAAGTEREHRTVLARQRRGLDQLLSLAEDRAKDLTTEQVSDLFAVVLSYQAASSRILSGRNEAAFIGNNPKAKALHQELTAARRRLSHLLLSGSRELDSGNVVKDYQRIESELSKETKGYRTLKLFFEAGPKELVPALPEDAALIEFIRFKRTNFQGDRHKLLHGEEGEDYYSAFVLSHEGLKLVSLGPARAIDNAIANWREQAIGREKQDPKQENAVLLKILWGPVEAALPGGIQDLRIVPDGQLALLPFEAIRRPGGEYVVERFRISYLATGRNLLSQREKRQSRGPFVIVGDPDYEALPASVSGSQGRREIPDDEILPRLPSFPAEARLVRDEIRARHPQVEIQLKVGADASEESLGKLSGPLRLLYFVTHGSYLKKAKAPPVAPEDADNPLLVAASTEGEEGQVRSVLALAGANVYPRRLASNLSDGRLTALEVEGLPMQPDLVVLSLCESATGKVIAGEDVMGLRHAFELAGARTVIGSLWTVPDESTAKLMEQFLRHWLDGMPKAEALRQAKLARLREVKAISFDGQSAAPVDWAGFIVHGVPE